MSLYDDERPVKPTLCRCGSTDFKYDKGFRGSQTQPPEPSGWYCHECETRDFEDVEAPDLFDSIGLVMPKFPEVRG